MSIVYRKDLDRVLTSDEVDNNFLALNDSILHKHFLRTLEITDIESNTHLDNVIVFAIPFPYIPTVDKVIAFDIVIKSYDTEHLLSSPFDFQFNQVNITVESGGSVSVDGFPYTFDTESRILYLRSNNEIVDYRFLEFFISSDSFNIVLDDSFDKTLSYTLLGEE